jgi:1-acyl-sn-glycerol-3-phosphate acyltransferase
MKEQKWKGQLPPEHFWQYQAWARCHPPDWVYLAFKIVMTLYLPAFHRMEVYGRGNIPQEGPVIIVPNHFSFMDHFFVGLKVGRRARFMAKSQLFEKKPMAWMFKHGGVFPVCRGHRDEEAFETARVLLESGQPIIMYVQGGRSRARFIEGDAKPGVGKLALMTGAPIVPVAVNGTQNLRDWRRGKPFSKVRVLYGAPMRFEVVENATREQQQYASEEVYAEIKRLYAKLETTAR